MSKAQAIFDARFAQPHQPRSDAYKRGLLYMLQRKFGEIGKQDCPYRIGSAEADAYYAGCEEGLLRYKIAQDAEDVIYG